jgi:hypothetical protein
MATYKNYYRTDSRFRHYLLFFLLFFLSINSSAQYQDFRSWWSIDLSKDLSKDLKAGLEIGQRFKENSLAYDRSLATFELAYEVFKDFSLEGGYRFIATKDKYLNLGSKYRIHGSASYDYKFDRLTLKLREQLQYGYDDFTTLNELYSNNLTNRNKFSVDYNFFASPFSVKSSYELFIKLSDATGVNISDHRFQLGLNMVLNSKADIEVAYMFNKEVNKINPLSSNVLVLGFNYDF